MDKYWREQLVKWLYVERQHAQECDNWVESCKISDEIKYHEEYLNYEW